LAFGIASGRFHVGHLTHKQYVTITAGCCGFLFVAEKSSTEAQLLQWQENTIVITN
jgi:hypothetical protein